MEPYNQFWDVYLSDSNQFLTTFFTFLSKPKKKKKDWSEDDDNNNIEPTANPFIRNKPLRRKQFRNLLKGLVNQFLQYLIN